MEVVEDVEVVDVTQVLEVVEVLDVVDAGQVVEVVGIVVVVDVEHLVVVVRSGNELVDVAVVKVVELVDEVVELVDDVVEQLVKVDVVPKLVVEVDVVNDSFTGTSLDSGFFPPLPVLPDASHALHVEGLQPFNSVFGTGISVPLDSLTPEILFNCALFADCV